MNLSEQQKFIQSLISPTDREKIVISEDRGTPADHAETAKIEAILKNEFKLVKTEESEALLHTVIDKLRKIVIEWVKQVAIKTSQTPEVIEKAGGELYIGGSYRLGAHGSTSDIDALCVAPKFVTRKLHFFGDLVEILKKDKNVGDLHAIDIEFAPIIKLKFMNVDVDLLFANIAKESVDCMLNLHDDNIFFGCDVPSINALNLIRNNDMIIELVPNKDVFRTVLKCIKVWAKNRCLYSNKMGFPGGISWAIMTAKICQMYPNLPPNRLLERLFGIYSRWDWKNPILLCENREPKMTSGLESVPKNWVAKNYEGRDLMPVITPSPPTINSTNSMKNANKQILLKEFVRAKQIMRKINTHAPGYGWMALFKKYDFFKEYFHYLRIDALTPDYDMHLKWEGFIESKLKLLIEFIEQAPTCNGIEHLRPLTKPFVLTNSTHKFNSVYLIGFKIKQSKGTEKYETDLRDVLNSYCWEIMKSEHAKNLKIDMKICYVTRDNLPIEVFPNGIRPKYPKIPVLDKNAKPKAGIRQNPETEAEEINELYKGESLFKKGKFE